MIHSAIIDDEVLMIENGGEMPEVAMHGCLYYLAMDPDGPRLTLAAQDLLRLKKAVVEGYRKIIVRDLTLENRGKGHYRGLARSSVNWQRLSRFCQREGLDASQVAQEVCELLQRFMEVEHDDVLRQRRARCINCSTTELLAFFAGVGFNPGRLPEGWQGVVCCSEPPVFTRPR